MHTQLFVGVDTHPIRNMARTITNVIPDCFFNILFYLFKMGMYRVVFINIIESLGIISI